MVNNIPANAGDARNTGRISGLGRSSGVENGNPLQYSCPENAMDGRAWWPTVTWGCKESDMTEQVYICIPENPCFLCVHGVL